MKYELKENVMPSDTFGFFDIFDSHLLTAVRGGGAGSAAQSSMERAFEKVPNLGQVCEARWGPIAPCPEEALNGGLSFESGQVLQEASRIALVKAAQLCPSSCLAPHGDFFADFFHVSRGRSRVDSARLPSRKKKRDVCRAATPAP